MNKKHIGLIVIMILLSIVLIIRGTYAFFQTSIDNSNNEQMQITSGEMILSFTDTNIINLGNASPGSIETKTFTVESKGNLATKYNLKFTNINNNFLNNEIYYTLTGDNGIDTKGYISSEYAKTGDFYIATNIPIGKSTDEDHIHTYTLTLEFISKNTNQNYNQEAIFTSKINADNNAKAEVHVESLSTYCKDTPLSECMIEDKDKFGKELIDDDPDANIRYMGANPSNYIWFNCEDYSNPTEKTCERWRIIGSFKNIEKINGDGTTTEQNLIKIMNATPVTNGLPFDISNKESGAASDMGNNDWANSTLMKTLNPGYELNTNYNSDDLTSNSLYWNRQKGLCSRGVCTTGSAGETKECSFTDNGIRETTKQYIENIRWNIGSALIGTAENYYVSERSDNKTKIMKSSVWDGRVGLIYPSDFGYAVGGSVRNKCLTNILNANTAECGENNWLFTKRYTATMIASMDVTDRIFFLYYKDPTVIPYSNTNCAYSIEPVVYLTHDTKITSGDGTYEKPYVIGVN